MRIASIIILCWITLSGCAHLVSDEQVTDLSQITQQNGSERKIAVSRLLHGEVEYDYESKKQKAQWMACLASQSRAAVFVTDVDYRGFKPEEFCSSWIAQSFLSQNFDVIAVNPPGYGSSTGTKDFLGSDTIAAITAGISVAQERGAKRVEGAWGYGGGAAAVVLFAKSLGKLNWLILGGGMYDLEAIERSTSSVDWRNRIQEIRQKKGSRAIEDRSVGYEGSGVPSIVRIYHAQQDLVAPFEQARAFSDLLKTNGLTVNLQIIPQRDHNLLEAEHRQILDSLILGLAEVSAGNSKNDTAK